MQMGKQLELVGSKGNKMEKESGSVEQGLRLDPARLRLEESTGENWTWHGHRELSLSRKETVGLRGWRVCHFMDFKSKTSID